MIPPDVLAATHARAFEGERGWTAEEFAALVAAPGAILAGDARCFVLGRAVAGEAEILTLATDPAHRRQGLARQALAQFEALAAGFAQRIFLEVASDNAAARALYAAAGYAEAGCRRGYYARAQGPAVDALVLCKDRQALDI